ncbi:hypothetical protein Dimus_035570 [Dionaea muscipula]
MNLDDTNWEISKSRDGYCLIRSKLCLSVLSINRYGNVPAKIMGSLQSWTTYDVYTVNRKDGLCAESWLILSRDFDVKVIVKDPTTFALLWNRDGVENWCVCEMWKMGNLNCDGLLLFWIS